MSLWHHVSHDYITSTPINSTPRKKVSRKFFATFRIKMHGRRRKTALSSRGAGRDHKLSHAIRYLRRHLEATSRTITSTAHTFHSKVRVSSWTPTIWATERLTAVIGEILLTTQPFHRLKRLCLVPFSVINDVIMTSLLLIKVTYTLTTTCFIKHLTIH